MPQCCVKNCKNRQNLHRFPKNKIRRQLWTDALNMNGIQIANTFVCTNHFKVSDYLLEGYSSGLIHTMNVLHSNAVPSLVYKTDPDSESSIEQFINLPPLDIKKEDEDFEESIRKENDENVNIDPKQEFVEVTNSQDKIISDIQINSDVSLVKDEPEIEINLNIKEEIEDPLLLSSETKKQTKVNKQLKIQTWYYCSKCGKQFKKSSAFKVHMKYHEGIKDYECSVCNKQFTAKGHLKRHLKMHENIKGFECTICNKKYSDKYYLKDHMEIHEGKNNYKCLICDYEFIKKSAFNKHMKMHAGIFQCTICSKNFTQNSHLQLHLKFHKGIKDFECTTCGRKFTQNSALTRHVLNLHSKDKNYANCDICNKKFSIKDSLKRHMRLHEDTNDSKCPICDRRFSENRYLKAHMKAHNGIKEFECDICNKKYIIKGHLTAHMKHHEDAKDYKCEICNKSFIMKYSLTRHVKENHANDDEVTTNHEPINNDDTVENIKDEISKITENKVLNKSQDKMDLEFVKCEFVSENPDLSKCLVVDIIEEIKDEVEISQEIIEESNMIKQEYSESEDKTDL